MGTIIRQHVKLREDEVYYTSLKQKVEDLLEEYKQRQLTIEELLEELDKVREDLVDKATGKAESGLTYLQEPYYNKLSEVCEEYADYEVSQLKAIAVETQAMIEERVTPINDWTKKTDFKRTLIADLKVYLMQQDLSMEDASMLTGYFMSLAEIQYGIPEKR